MTTTAPTLRVAPVAYVRIPNPHHPSAAPLYVGPPYGALAHVKRGHYDVTATLEDGTTTTGLLTITRATVAFHRDCA